jgi:hypothetical protein
MIVRRVSAVLAAATLAACGGSSKDVAGGGGLTVTASVPSVKANGTNQVGFTVTGSRKGPIGIAASRGTFLSSGTATASFPATPFTATLVTCDSRVDAGCQGLVQVTATDADLATGRTSVSFAAVERCADGIDNDADGAVDCADSECPAGTSCSATGLVCGGGACATCTGNGGTPEATETSCADGFDNDCDGLGDCRDSNCLGQTCPTGQSAGGNPIFGTCKAGGTCTCVPSGGSETACGDGLDNDCDGLIDCADPNCQPVGNQAGQACSTARPGLTCSAPAATGGVSTCTVCAPSRNFLLAQPVETKCGDGIDNDCNGELDCQDANCAVQGLACDGNGQRCTSPDLQCRCPDLSGVETACADGLDNDCDGKVDCADADCGGRTCGANGRTCSGTSCACPGGQATETSCADGLDNDCDGLVDCADQNCRPTVAGGVGQACQSAPSRLGERCDFLGQCACPGGQVAETTCNDTLDNDCDGLVDCQDPDCVGKACGANGRTCPAVSPSVCSCPTGSTETGAQCADNADNNCDGLADCNDPGCQGSPTGAQCGPNPAQLCTQATPPSGPWICKDITTNYVLAVTAGVTRLAANGTATTSVTATLKDGSLVAVPNATIAFSTTLGSVGASALTNASGQATVTFTSSTGSGVAVVTADFTTATLQHVTATASITLPQLAQVNLVQQQYPVMGAFGSGFQEANELTFQLVDSNNQTYPRDLLVTFVHARLGGSYIGSSPLTECTANDCSTTGVTDAAGKVKVILHSGTLANVVSVIASAQAGGSSLLSATAGNIAIIGAKASGGEITISCSPRNIPAFIDDDCTNSNYGGADAKISCVVSLADRFKNTLGVATVVTYETEAGAAGPPASTPAYDTAKLPTQQSNLGKATNFVNATGFKLPADVAPFADEYALAHAWDGCPTRTHNPRDGLVTIISVVRGEEGFVDGSNGFARDGVYQVGENFIDMPEPFVDYNDNGIRDGNEPYTDFNGNGSWDQPNGVWDADAAIWAETRVVYTDYVVAAIGTGGEDLASRFYVPPFPQTTPFPTPPTPSFSPFFSVTAQQAGPPVVPATSETVPVHWTDVNFNMPNYKYTYGVSKSAGAKIAAAIPTGGSPTTLDGLGMGFTQQYCLTRTPTDPSTQCGSSCDTAPCYLVTDVGNFSYGTYGALTVTGGTQPDPGVVCGFVTATLKTTNTVNNQTTEVSRTMASCGTSP